MRGCVSTLSGLLTTSIINNRSLQLGILTKLTHVAGADECRANAERDSSRHDRSRDSGGVVEGNLAGRLWRLEVRFQGRPAAQTAELCQLQHQCRSTTIDLSRPTRAATRKRAFSTPASLCYENSARPLTLRIVRREFPTRVKRENYTEIKADAYTERRNI